ncbi:MAG: MGMT family protein [Flavobacteriaceae bacterium]|nr:cysteine methyltransferase [Flavobacteriaceae bacterium]|tara:strand:+ start:4988 stop:5317 length:330 start_codon:yes stop_codon:yes gene_type:complete
MENKSSFYSRVYEIVKLVPVGRITTYGHIAKYLGVATSARMVGYAMNVSHSNSEIPAHRVVNRNGILTGKHHFDGVNLMQELLESEGIVVKNDKIVDFEKIFWDPMIEL